jgi:hypothetical protein
MRTPFVVSLPKHVLSAAEAAVEGDHLHLSKPQAEQP